MSILRDSTAKKSRNEVAGFEERAKSAQGITSLETGEIVMIREVPSTEANDVFKLSSERKIQVKKNNAEPATATVETFGKIEKSKSMI